MPFMCASYLSAAAATPQARPEAGQRPKFTPGIRLGGLIHLKRLVVFPMEIAENFKNIDGLNVQLPEVAQRGPKGICVDVISPGRWPRAPPPASPSSTRCPTRPWPRLRPVAW
jgi:hypothetical protein